MLSEFGIAEVSDIAEPEKVRMIGEPGEKEKIETLQDVQCPATCRGLRRGPGRGRICGKRCCLRYGHLCTHRCDDHWNWNLEVEEIYFVKDGDYVRVFMETNEMSREIITTVLNKGNVRVNGESDADGVKEVLEDTEEDDSYEKVPTKEKIDEDVIDKYVGLGIYDVSENREKDKQNAKETDLCEPIHIEIKTSVEVRKDHDIQLESVTGEYT